MTLCFCESDTFRSGLRYIEVQECYNTVSVGTAGEEARPRCDSASLGSFRYIS